MREWVCRFKGMEKEQESEDICQKFNVCTLTINEQKGLTNTILVTAWFALQPFVSCIWIRIIFECISECVWQRVSWLVTLSATGARLRENMGARRLHIFRLNPMLVLTFFKFIFLTRAKVDVLYPYETELHTFQRAFNLAGFTSRLIKRCNE